MITKPCRNCGAIFDSYPSHKRVSCSRECEAEWRKKEKWRKSNRPCQMCGKLFVPKHTKSPGLFCSYKCSGLANRSERIDRCGYWAIRMPEHPAANCGYVFEHRLLMEREIGRYLTNNEIVHHINEDRKDNRLENLQLMTVSEHNRLHALEMPRKNGKYGARS